jgi:predicted RNA-binding protein
MFSSIISDKKSGYFVCSDDKATEDKFNELKNVLVYPKTSYVEKLVDGEWTTKIKDSEGRIFPYNVDRSKQSVIEAFIDLLILSRTNIIIRNKSSFLGWAKIYALVSDLDSFSQ